MSNDNTRDAAEPSPASAGSQDITKRLRRWTHAVDSAPASDLMDEAASEIVALRVSLRRQSVAANQAVKMMGKYAERAGFLLGGLEMAAAGYATADKVLQALKAKYLKD
ncbi:MAG: hypothetical protein EBS90_07750 [Betaproteobacteria bacterium]|nr:hypothetical protein [Betaproteobacteria bacterium]